MSLPLLFALWLGPFLSLWLIAEAFRVYAQAKALRRKLAKLRP